MQTSGSSWFVHQDICEYAFCSRQLMLMAQIAGCPSLWCSACGDYAAGVLPVCKSRTDATAWLDVHARINHCHFCAADSAGNHDLVIVAKVTNPKYLTSHLRQADAQGQIVSRICIFDDLCAVNSLQQAVGRSSCLH